MATADALYRVITGLENGRVKARVVDLYLAFNFRNRIDQFL